MKSSSLEALFLTMVLIYVGCWWCCLHFGGGGFDVLEVTHGPHLHGRRCKGYSAKQLIKESRIKTWNIARIMRPDFSIVLVFVKTGAIQSMNTLWVTNLTNGSLWISWWRIGEAEARSTERAINTQADFSIKSPQIRCQRFRHDYRISIGEQCHETEI